VRDSVANFYAFATRNFWVQEALCSRVCLSTSESVHPENIVNTISQKPIKGISTKFGHIGFINVLIRFWG